MENQRFEALSRICLNNWHYIKHRTLSFDDGINFFTGHSGSGKSTVIDAMQIVLYANTDGRGFFNKAAADDSDRSLIEYLRGMINIGDDNSFSYLRNQNFSSTIVLELRQTDTGVCQCVGVVFDVETATNEISRMFFWHKGPMPDHEYRKSDRTMSIDEVKNWLLSNFSKEDCYFGSHNERFRKQLYDIYLGGLDAEKFPLLFKRAIPFRMNIKLEDFVKEYICVEQNIHIEDMQQSVTEYGRLRHRIEDTCREIESLKKICAQHEAMAAVRTKKEMCGYFAQKLDILNDRRRIRESQEKIQNMKADYEKANQEIAGLETEIQDMTAQSEELLRKISSSGYEELKSQLKAVNELVEHLGSSQARWKQTAEKLHAWDDEEITSNRTLWDIEAFDKGDISEEALKRLRDDLAQMRKETERQMQEARSQIRELNRELQKAQEEVAQLKAGNKAYPKELEAVREVLKTQLFLKTGKSVDVEVLADLLEVRDDAWRNAIEGYLGNNKLLLTVEPKYAKTAMEIYKELDPKKYYRVAVLDTERVMADEQTVQDGALAEEVEASRDYAQAYINFQLGKVIKCESVDELRSHRIGITKECVLYHSYRIQHINPDLYTKSAYIGKKSVRQRIRILEESMGTMKQELEPLQTLLTDGERVLGHEALGQELDVYLGWQKDKESYLKKQEEQKDLRERLEQLKSQNVAAWVEERTALDNLRDSRKALLREKEHQSVRLQENCESENKILLQLNEIVIEKERTLKECPEYETKLQAVLTEKEERGARIRYDQMRNDYQAQAEMETEKQTEEMQKLQDIRSIYLRTYPQRNFSLGFESNEEYQKLLDNLACDRLEEYRKRAAEQAKAAVEHFKDDFMYKIRSAIKEALQRKDELNRIISRLDFGKDRYQFYIGKNKGADGKYYDMFMDDALEVNPSDLDIGLDNQLNLFTMEHESHYGAMINDLINIFIPPEHATPEEMEEAKRNMEKYADYRTYLSFDMQQLIQNEDETIKIRLSKMIRKNSGGEGQNPLYVALLASFAQAYKIDLKPGLRRNPTIRLVVLDEAFSKMDAEKVASCIKLIRGLGFQALISATNDKIQNYLETVDKIFVFANPNKKAISIQEFEKPEFEQLKPEISEEDDED